MHHGINPYTRCGHEILRHGRHFADAVDDEGASLILEALSATYEISDADQFVFPMDDDIVRNCHPRRENDEMFCPVHKVRWAYGEEHP